MNTPLSSSPSGSSADVSKCSGLYRAEQVPGAVILHASGSHNTSGYSVFFEQLPPRVYPPQFALHHIKSGDIVLQMVTPFAISTWFPATEPVEVITVFDAEGQHEVPVEPAFDRAACHGSILNANTQVEDGKENSVKMEFLEGHAWFNKMPGSPSKLIVTGKCTFPTAGYEANLSRSIPQGFNPAILLLDLNVKCPSGPSGDVVSTQEVRFEEGTDVVYSHVTILPLGVTLPVEIAQ